MKNIKVSIVVLFLLSGLFNASTYGQAISFSPGRIFFKGNPGETVTETVTIVNSGTEVYEFITHLEDWKRDSLGNRVHFPAGSLPGSNSADISLSASNLKIGPGERKTFMVSMTIPPREVKQATNSMLLFTQTNARESNTKNAAGIGVKMSLELGVQIFYTPYTAKTGDLKFIAFENQTVLMDGSEQNKLAVKFENTGMVNKDAYIRFELTNRQTGEEIKIPAIPVSIMPNDVQWVYCPIGEKIKVGEYLAVAILDAGNNNNLKIAEKTIYVKK